jgi:hypothetical protein
MSAAYKNSSGGSGRKGKDKDVLDPLLSSDHQMDIDELEHLLVSLSYSSLKSISPVVFDSSSFFCAFLTPPSIARRPARLANEPARDSVPVLLPLPLRLSNSRHPIGGRVLGK